MINEEKNFSRAYQIDKKLFFISEEMQLDLQKLEIEFVKPNNLYNENIDLEQLNFFDTLESAEFITEQVDFSRRELRIYIKHSDFFNLSKNVQDEYYKFFNLNNYQVALSEYNYYLLSLKNYNYYKINDKKRDIKTFVREPYSIVVSLSEELFDKDELGTFIIVKDLRVQKTSHFFEKNFEEDEYNNNINYINLIPNFSINLEPDTFFEGDGLTYNDIISNEEVINEGSSSIIQNFINIDTDADYSDKNNFVKFGSAKLLLENFVKKIFTIKKYSSLSGYERYLFKNWTKKSGKAYQLELVENLSDDDFYYEELSACEDFDKGNFDRLLSLFVPEYLIKEENLDFINFIDFIGNVYDNFRTKSKFIREKYQVFDFNKDISFLKKILLESNLIPNTNFDFEGISNTIMQENKDRLDYNIVLRLVETLPFLRATKGTIKALKAINNIYGNYFDIEKSGESVLVYRFNDDNSGEEYILEEESYNLLFTDEETTEEYVNNNNFLKANIIINNFLTEDDGINDVIKNINDIIGNKDSKKVQSSTLKQLELLTPYRTNFRASKVLIQEHVSESFKHGFVSLIDNTFYSDFRRFNYETTKDLFFVEDILMIKNIVNSFTTKDIGYAVGEVNECEMIRIKNFTSYEIEIEKDVIEKFGTEDVKIDVVSADNTRVKTDES